MNEVAQFLSRYALSVKVIPAEDGGGFHMFFPTIGFLAVNGVGDTLEEACESLVDGLKVFLRSNPSLPLPTAFDVSSLERAKDNLSIYEPHSNCANNNFAFAS